MSLSPNAAERIQAQTRAMQGREVKCDRCGSSHFYEVQISKYLSGGSGSVEIMADPNEQVHPLLMCPCGMPILPKPAVGRRAGGVYETSHKGFRESINKAQDYVRANSPKVVADNLMEAVAGKVEVAALATRIDKLEQDLGAGPAGDKDGKSK